MKKVVVKTPKKSVKNKSNSDIEMLASLVRNGFEKIDERFEQVDKHFDKIDERFDKIDARFEKNDRKFESIDSQLFAIHNEQKETNRRLDSLERKQSGLLSSLDETVHRSEFKVLVNRVGQLEKQVLKK